MSISMTRVATFAVVALATVALTASPATARPNYFDIFTSHYGISGSDNLNACGVCHFKWAGTGGRNAYGNAVEQQLYLGKSLVQSLNDIEGDDTDSDGFTNGDEIMNFMTLPGYSCSDFFLAQDPPNDWHTFITPMVASCLVPHDIRVSPTEITAGAAAGNVLTVDVEIFNNGNSVPLEITSVAYVVDGAPAVLTVSAPATPFTIPVNGSVIAQIQFAPNGFIIVNDDLRIESDDPDEPVIDIPVEMFGIIVALASPEEREACFRDIDKNFRRYSKRHLNEWNRCYVDEVQGIACDTTRRDSKIQKAEAKMRERIGGVKDRRCSAAGVTPSLLGYPDFCGGGCGAIETNDYDGLLDCLVCRQDEARDALLGDALGTAPPDLPANVIAGSAVSCQRKLLKQGEKAVAKALKIINRCEAENVTAAVPVDCETEHADDLAKLKTKVDEVILKCSSTVDMDGCSFQPPPSPGCVGDAALSITGDLRDTVFGLE